MKILHLITKSELGGAQTHVAQLCGYFKSRGFEIGVMSFPGGWLEDECKKLGVSFFANPYFSNSPNPIKIWHAGKEIKRLIKVYNPDIVHCHGSAAGVLGRMVVRGSVPTIFTAHGWSFNHGVPLWQKIFGIVSEKICAKYTAQIIAVCNFVRAYGLKHGIAPLEKFTVIYNGIEEQPPIIKNSSDKVKIIFVGRLAAPKDPFLLLNALAQSMIKDKLELNIIGAGPQEQAIKDLIKTLGLNNVKMLGALPRAQVFDILSQSDIFVLTTDWEGFPYAVLEAMSVGLPVIASDVGGICEAVSKDTGILVKKGDQNELQAAIERLSTDSNLRLEMGKAARAMVLKNFSLDKMFKETEEVYNNICQKN